MSVFVQRVFDLSPTAFPWRAELRQSITSRRQTLDGYLFFDRLLEIAELDPVSLYPPTSVQTFELLIHAIETCHFDNLKKHCLIYYILKFWGDQREERFAEQKSIPPQFAILSDAYWYLDQGYIEPAVHKLCDPRVTPDFVSKILRTIANMGDSQLSSKLLLRFVKMGQPLLVQPDDMDLYMDALCESNMMEAWIYQRKFPEDVKHDGTRTRLLRRILDFCLLDKVRPTPLKALVAFPFSSFEDQLVISYALKPPPQLTAGALSVLQELITVRLIHQGRYTEIIQLDKQFAAAPTRSGDDSMLLAKTAEGRRQTIQELIKVLPPVQRKLLEVEFVGQASSAPLAPAASSNDLSMSWEGMDTSIASLNASTTSWSMPYSSNASMSFVSDMLRSQPSTSSPYVSKPNAVPISASSSFRQANPQVAVLQAFSQTSRMEGSPSTSKTSSAFAGTTSSLSNSVRRPTSTLGNSVPFGSESRTNVSLAASAGILSPSLHTRKGPGASPSLSKILHRPAFNINGRANGNATAPQGVLGLSTSREPASTGSFGVQLADPDSNPFYRPSQEDIERAAEKAASTSLRPKRSFGQVAKATSPIRDIEMDDADSEDDIVINPSRYNPRSVGSLIAAIPSPKHASTDSQSAKTAQTSKTTDDDANLEDKDVPGAFPVPDMSSTTETVSETHAAGRRTRGRSTQPESAPPPPSRRSSRVSASKPTTTTTGRPVKKSAVKASRASKAKEKERVDESDGEGEEEGRLGVATRRSSRLSVTSSTGSPERKKQRSVEPDVVPSDSGAAKKPTRTSTRKSNSSVAVAGPSSVGAQPSRVSRRRQTAPILEE